MNEKYLLSRIAQKHDIETNWNNSPDFIPMRGELIVYDIDANYDYERLKIGDGATTVVDLPFVDENVSWNTLKDKPFGEVETGGNTLTWDGNITGRVSVSVVSSDGVEFVMCKVSDALPTMENFNNGCLIVGDIGYGFQITFAYPNQSIFQTEAGLITIEGYGIWIVPEDNFHYVDDYCDFILPEKGVYFYKSSYEGPEYYYSTFGIPGYNEFTLSQPNIKQLDEKYLPEHNHTWDDIIDKPFGEVTTGSETLTWNGEGGISGLYLHRKISDAVPTMADLAKGVRASKYYPGGDNFFDISPDRIITDGRVIVCDGVFTIILEDIGEFTKGTYFYKFDRNYTTSLTITGYTGFNETTTIAKIDKKYLPDIMPEVTTEDDGKFLCVVDGVWAASIPSAEDVGARPNTWMPTAAEVGADESGAANTALTDAKSYTDDKLASFSSCPYIAGTTAPDNTNLLWIDTNATTGGLKYYNGTEWVHVPVAYT